MRYPAGHKQAVRARIIEEASHALRREGLAGVSIPALMKQVGLTHGGFYGHFEDRDELVAAAVAFAGEESRAKIFADPAGGLEQVLQAYLSTAHVKDPAGGCSLAALGTEATRQAPAVREAFAEAARGLLKLVQEKRQPGSPADSLDDETLALTARMVGAVMLARLVGDETLADRILAAARHT